MNIDSHCHLQDPAFDSDRDSIIRKAQAAGVVKFCCDSSNEPDWIRVEHLYRRYGANVIRPGFGIHPWYAGQTSSGWQDRLIRLLNRLPDSIVAEIGLDCIHQAEVSLEIQHAVFTDQLEIARQVERPVTIHCARAWEQMIAVLKAAGKLDVLITFHAFSGTIQDIKWLLARYNVFFSYGSHLFRSDKTGVHQTWRWLKDNAPERICYESDSPFMPLIKGSRNTPDLMAVPFPEFLLCGLSHNENS